MITISQVLLLIVDIAKWIILANVIMSWLINFQVLNLRQPLVAQIWNGLNQILEPLYSRIRRMLPATGGIDFAPLIVIIVVFFLQRLVATGGF